MELWRFTAIGPYLHFTLFGSGIGVKCVGLRLWVLGIGCANLGLFEVVTPELYVCPEVRRDGS